MHVHARLRTGVVAGLLAVAGLGVGASSASAALAGDGSAIPAVYHPEGPAGHESERSTGYIPYIEGTATPKVEGLRIRSGPSTHTLAEGLLYRGDRMRVTGTVRRPSTGTWFHVDLTHRSASGLRRGFRGWVYASYLRRY